MKNINNFLNESISARSPKELKAEIEKLKNNAVKCNLDAIPGSKDIFMCINTKFTGNARYEDVVSFGKYKQGRLHFTNVSGRIHSTVFDENDIHNFCNGIVGKKDYEIYRINQENFEEFDNLLKQYGVKNIYK